MIMILQEGFYLILNYFITARLSEEKITTTSSVLQTDLNHTPLYGMNTQCNVSFVNNL